MEVECLYCGEAAEESECIRTTEKNEGEVFCRTYFICRECIKANIPGATAPDGE